MRFVKMIFSLPIPLSLLACAAYTPEPLGVNHPAHAAAATAAAAPVSKTLVYAAVDMPSGTAISNTAAEAGGHDTHHGSDSATQTAVGEGKVIAVVPGSKQLVIEHGAIKDFMDAMTMGYATDSASLLEGLKAGDKVRFTIDVKRKVIVKVEKMT
jgi:Cu/Ag efflux protein CusF